MKKMLMYGMMAAAAMTFTSCDKDTENSFTNSYLIPAYNLFTPISGEGTPFVGIGAYNFTLRMPAETFEVGVSAMPAPGGVAESFLTKPLSFTSRYARLDNTLLEEIKFKSEAPLSDSDRVKDLNVLLTQAAYSAPEGSGLQGYTPFIPGTTRHYAYMQYVYNNEWNVRTFWPDVTFNGVTTTTYPGMEAPFVNDKMSYRVVMQRKENVIGNKADVIFYNAKFAPNAPEIVVVLKDLDLKFTNSGYEMTGSDVVPYMMEGAGLTETPRYKFNSFALSVAGNMTRANVSYRVADVFNGTFQGDCVFSLEIK